HRRPLSLVMLDADHFKRINDTAGHTAGDEVLQQIVREAKRTLRAADLIGRLGGEEFALLLPATTRQEAAAIAERLRVAIEQLPIETGGQVLHATVSLGVAALGETQAELDDLLAAADRALYEAKRAGRNCVRVEDVVKSEQGATESTKGDGEARPPSPSAGEAQ
ncbi:MAG: GGDEF domain-containing protein, partial [Burkholderiales bacterium]|nr:GGDEF domain-containing protein [Burkholderiales bacterium]